MVQQTSQVFYVKDPMSEHWHIILHRKKQVEVIDDIENGNLPSLIPIIMNKDDIKEIIIIKLYAIIVCNIWRYCTNYMQLI